MGQSRCLLPCYTTSAGRRATWTSCFQETQMLHRTANGKQGRLARSCPGKAVRGQSKWPHISRLARPTCAVLDLAAREGQCLASSSVRANWQKDSKTYTSTRRNNIPQVWHVQFGGYSKVMSLMSAFWLHWLRPFQSLIRLKSFVLHRSSSLLQCFSLLDYSWLHSALFHFYLRPLIQVFS